MFEIIYIYKDEKIYYTSAPLLPPLGSVVNFMRKEGKLVTKVLNIEYWPENHYINVYLEGI